MSIDPGTIILFIACLVTFSFIAAILDVASQERKRQRELAEIRRLQRLGSDTEQ